MQGGLYQGYRKKAAAREQGAVIRDGFTLVGFRVQGYGADGNKSDDDASA
jgi:hypothetical protein